MSQEGSVQVDIDSHYQNLNQQGVSEKASLAGWGTKTCFEGEPSKDNISMYVDMVNSEDKATQLNGVIAIRKLLSIKENPPIQEIIDSGIVPKLLIFMKQDDTKFQYESAWAVTNICSGTSEDVEYVVNLGGLNTIIDLLNSTSVEVLDQAVWALGNIAGDNTSYRDMCLEKGLMDKFIQVIQNNYHNHSIKRNSVWAMSNLVRGKPIPQWDKISNGIPVLKQVITESSFGDALVDALWGISWTSETYIQEVIDLGCVPHLVSHLNNDMMSILVPSLRALGNIVTGNDTQTNVVLSCPGFLPRVFDLTNNQKKAVRKEACWLISNIAAGNHNQIAQLIEHAHYVDALKKVLIQDLQDVIIEASWALGNLASGAKVDQIDKMVKKYGYVSCLKEMLANFSPKVKKISLEACLNVLYSGGQPGNNVYVKIFQEEGIVSHLKDVVKSSNQVLVTLAEDILVFFNQQEVAKSENIKVVSQVNSFVAEGEYEEEEHAEQNEELDKDSESEEEEEDDDDSERSVENIGSQEEEDDEKYKNMERED